MDTRKNYVESEGHATHRNAVSLILVPEREVEFVFRDNVLESGPMVEVGDLAGAAAAEADEAISLTA